jgi:hypothetical protein
MTDDMASVMLLKRQLRKEIQQRLKTLTVTQTSEECTLNKFPAQS